MFLYSVIVLVNSFCHSYFLPLSNLSIGQFQKDNIMHEGRGDYNGLIPRTGKEIQIYGVGFVQPKYTLSSRPIFGSTNAWL